MPTHAELAAKLLRDAAAFFNTIAKENPPLKEQMDDNSSVFKQVADLVENAPTGAVAGSEETEWPKPTRLTKKSTDAPTTEVKPQVATPKRQGKRAASTPEAAATPSKSQPKKETIPYPDADPLSDQNVRLNGHTSFVDPSFGVSYPNRGSPNPITLLPRKIDNLRKAVILERDNHVCHFCGFRSTKYQEIVSPHDAVSQTQAVTACIMCAQVTALDKVPTMKSGVLLHLPEMGQAELNVFARIIYVCRISQGKVADLARATLEKLMERRLVAREKFGTDDPFNLAHELAQAKTPEAGRDVQKRVADLRLFPLDRRIIKEGDLEFNQFPQILAYWRSKDGPFGPLPPPKMDMGHFRARVEEIFGPIKLPVKDDA